MQDAMQWMTEAGFGSVVELEKTAVVQGVKLNGSHATEMSVQHEARWSGDTTIGLACDTSGLAQEKSRWNG